MIQANELRIGNVLLQNGRIIYVSHRIISDIASAPNNHNYVPIPLSPEWLNKLGIRYSEGLGYSYPFAENFNLYLTKGVFKECQCTIMQYSEGDELLKHIKYVHQFQNLYFALTGEELTIKEQYEQKPIH